MANQSKLKAWVRYDGTGRVVTAGPIFQANKPKVGNWRQINANLCCNSSNTTTTTTTQGGGGGVTPTAFVKGYWTGTYYSCTTTTAGNLVFYSASTDVQAGITVFSDATLTTPVTNGWVIQAGPGNMTKYLVGADGVLSEYVCPTVYTVGIDTVSSGACNYNIMQDITTNDNLTLSNSTVTITSTGTSFSNLLSLPIGSTFYVSFGAIVWQYEISGAGAFSATRISNGANC